MKNTSFIVASGSKSRADMLRAAGVSFEVIRPMVDEEPIKTAMQAEKAPARDIADILAEHKARSVSVLYPDALVLGSDQILFTKDNTVISKASTRSEAAQTLKTLSGVHHTLFSAAVLMQAGQAVWRTVDSAKLSVRSLSDEFIDHYLDMAGDDILGCVGCYQLEGPGAQLFDRIDGNYFTILGMPLIPVLDILRRYQVLVT